MSIVKVMRANLFWYVPVWILALLIIVVPNARSAYANVVMLWRNWTWGFFISPSAYVCFGTMLESVVLPIQILLWIPPHFEQRIETHRRRYWLALAAVVAIPVSAVLLQLVIWGSFPLDTDRAGHGHLRMIPFIPWPD